MNRWLRHTVIVALAASLFMLQGCLHALAYRQWKNSDASPLPVVQTVRAGEQ